MPSAALTTWQMLKNKNTCQLDSHDQTKKPLKAQEKGLQSCHTTSRVTLSRLLTRSEPQFPHLQSNKNIHPLEPVKEINEMVAHKTPSRVTANGLVPLPFLLLNQCGFFTNLDRRNSPENMGNAGSVQGETTPRRACRFTVTHKLKPLEKEMATHSSILAWKIPWAEEPGRLQSTGLQRVRRD